MRSKVRRLFRPLRMWLWRRRHGHKPVEGCVEYERKAWCRGESERHGWCDECGELTCAASMKIDPHSLRRRKIFLCWPCKRTRIHEGESYRDSELRKKRARHDWEQMTDPVVASRIVTARMGEQYPGVARQTIRAFRESGADFALAPDVDAAVLQSTITTLGLDDELYAETRGLETVLRRIEDA